MKKSTQDQEALALAVSVFSAIDNESPDKLKPWFPVVMQTMHLLNSMEIDDDLGLNLWEFAQLKSERSKATDVFRTRVQKTLDELKPSP